MTREFVFVTTQLRLKRPAVSSGSLVLALRGVARTAEAFYDLSECPYIVNSPSGMNRYVSIPQSLVPDSACASACACACA